MQKQQRATQTEKANECWARLILFCGSSCGVDDRFPAASARNQTQLQTSSTAKSSITPFMKINHLFPIVAFLAIASTALPVHAQSFVSTNAASGGTESTPTA